MLLAQIPTWAIGLLVALFLLVSVGLILTVLIQRPMGGGLSGAFGSGAGSGQTAFGAKTGDVLTMFTIIVFAVWLLGAVGLNFATRPPSGPTPAQVSPTGAGESAAEQAEGQGATPADDQAAPATPEGEQAPPEDQGAGDQAGGDQGAGEQGAGGQDGGDQGGGDAGGGG